MTERVRVGQVVAPFGVDGAVKVYPLTDFSDRFSSGSELWLGDLPLKVEWSRKRPGGVVVKLSGIDDRTRADLHRGRYLEVTEDQLRQLPEDHFYHRQLVGMEVETIHGHRLGRITQVLEKPANDVWVSEHAGQEHLIPATKDAVLEVDMANRRVVVAEWLLKVEDA
jgi:16S rRNA processing protein RimM